jgi:hypothetical protein
MNTARTLILAVCALFAASPMAAELPGNFTAHYALSLNGFKLGESKVSLDTQADNRYRYRSHTYSTGVAKLFRSDTVRESSQFTLHQERIRPQEYRFDHTGDKKERHALLKFDWQAHKVSNTVEGHTWEMKIPAGTLDKFVVQLAVMMDLRNGEKMLSYAIADGGKLKQYQFAVIGEETVKVPAGEFATLKLERLRKDNDRTTYFWCAPDLGYLPVKIKQIEHEDGVTYLSELQETTLGKPPVTISPVTP